MNLLGKLKEYLGKKAIYVAVGLALNALRAKHPDWPLPDQDAILKGVGALLGLHTFMDALALLKGLAKPVAETALAELGKAADKQEPSAP